jgi:hypothetical protein
VLPEWSEHPLEVGEHSVGEAGAYLADVDEFLADMSLPDADRHARAQIEYHRDKMSEWKRACAERIAAEYERGKPVEDIAAELHVSAATVYEVMRAARPDPKKPGRKKRGARQPAATAAPELVVPADPAHELVSEPFEDRA